MTSPSRKSRPTTRPSTSAASRSDAAAVYAAVDLATRPAAAVGEPLWLPAGWLAVVLMLAAATPSFGAPPATDGWRPRGHAARIASETPRAWRTLSPIQPVAYEDDIAGPALRVAGRMRSDQAYGDRVVGDGYSDDGYRVAQRGGGFGDPLEDALSRPFGVDDSDAPDADAADRLFDELPAEPADEEQPMDDYSERGAPTGSLFDDEPEPRAEPSPAAERRDLADDFGASFDRDDVDDSWEEERREAIQDCAEGLAELKAARLDTIDLYIGVPGDEGEDYPFACSLDDGSVHAPRCWAEVTYMWKASGLCHKPLYFQDVQLERYGHSWGPYVQPLLSGAHFFGRLPILPYMMGLQAPNECVYTLGHYRPGSCAPYMIDPIPFTWRAAIFQAGASVGVAAILP